MNSKETVTINGTADEAPEVDSRGKIDEDAGSGLGHDPGQRTLRRQLPRKNPVECPVCGLSLRPSELRQHYELEIERLTKLPKSRERRSTTSPRSSSRASLRRIRANRSARRRRLREFVSTCEGEESTQCPVCQDTIVGSPDVIADHVDACLRNSEETGDTFEEYEWAGQTRVRATSLLEGGIQAVGLVTRTQEDEDVDIELDVDGDDSETYGGPQYSEADVVHLPPEPQGQNQQQMDEEASETELTAESSGETNVDIPAAGPLVQNAMRERMRQLESPHVRCLVCLEAYVEPAVSVCCWHVHCKDCWLRTLGAKKLCPQCNSITSPADLRRIFL